MVSPISILVFVAPELQSTNETFPVEPPVFSNDQQTQLGVGGTDVADGVCDGDGKQTAKHNSNVEYTPPGTGGPQGQLYPVETGTNVLDGVGVTAGVLGGVDVFDGVFDGGKPAVVVTDCVGVVGGDTGGVDVFDGVFDGGKPVVVVTDGVIGGVSGGVAVFDGGKPAVFVIDGVGVEVATIVGIVLVFVGVAVGVGVIDVGVFVGVTVGVGDGHICKLLTLPKELNVTT